MGALVPDGVYLLMVRPQYDPAAERVAQVYHACTATEAQYLRESCRHREDQDLEMKGREDNLRK